MTNAVAQTEKTQQPPPPMIGLAELRRLQVEGWEFHDGGIKLADGYATWGSKGEEQKPFFLADPDKYPEAWMEEETQLNLI